MEEMLERVSELSKLVYEEWINTAESTPEKVSDAIYASYQQLDIARARLSRLIHRKNEEQLGDK